MQVNAERMRLARERAKLSRRQLAQKLEVSWTTIWRIEIGRVAPRSNTLGAWAEACGVRIDSLYEAA